MKIKNQLLLSFGFLFAVILFLGGVGSYYIDRLARESMSIIRDNNQSLVYMQQIDDALEDIQFALFGPEQAEGKPSLEEYLAIVRSSIDLQRSNITERGEEKLTGDLSREADQLVAILTEPEIDELKAQVAMHRINSLVNTIYNLNQDAVTQRIANANDTANKIFLSMVIFGACGIIVGLLVTLSVPFFILRPIRSFNEAIGKIARGKYDVQVEVNRKNEFGGMARSFNFMAQKLKEYERSNYAELLFEKKRLDTVINQFTEAIIGLSEHKNIIFVNDKALTLLSLRREQLIGKYAPDVAAVNPLMQQLIAELMIGFESWEEMNYPPIRVAVERVERLFSKDVINVVTTPTGEKHQVLIGHVIVLTDITEFAEKDRAKTRFIATLSHELKTPVTAIDLTLTLLKNKKVGSLTGGQRDLLNTIGENNQRIQRAINEILEFSKIESGGMEVATVKAGIGKMIEQAVSGVLPLAKDKQIEINTLISDPDSIHVMADPKKTVWVLNNFLTNAIRYSQSGDVIEITAEETQYDVTVSVKDYGKGIHPGEIDKLFEPYSRTEDDETEGTGLGLAISKEFIEAMGGSIGVKSDEGAGAEFWIKLRKR